MDDRQLDKNEFSRYVCAWLDPLRIAEAGIRYDTDLSAALTQTTLCCSSYEQLKSGKDAALLSLVSQFLNNFTIPTEVLRILESLVKVKVSRKAWEWLGDIKFEGEITAVDRDNQSYPEGTILVIKERDCVADILAQPIAFLCYTVGEIVSQMSKINNLSIYLNPLWPDHRTCCNIPVFTYYGGSVY